MKSLGGERKGERRETEIFNQWNQSLDKKDGTSVFIVTPEDCQDLRRMEREAGF
jgi:hypothetical protein